MADSNRLRLSYVEEVTLGTTPNSPAMRTIRPTGEGLNHDVETIESKELRSDRQTSDTMQVGAQSAGPINFEFSFPTHRTWLRDFLRYSLFSAAWTEMPELYNVTSDSVITAVTDSSDTYTVAAGGASFKANHLVRASGFTNAANNQLFKCASSTGTTVVAAGTPTMTDEAAPPAGARLKVVGFEGAEDDISAVSAGLASAVLDFTTLGLIPGQWIRIGGSATVNQFATAALNASARIATVEQNLLTLDNKPTGWTTDAGTGKSIRVYAGDVLRNGTTKTGVTVEKGFMDLAVPEYLGFIGLVVGGMSLSIGAKEVVTGAFTMMGMSHTVGTVSLGTPAAAGSARVVTASANVGRLAENGVPIAAPNFVKSVSIELQNNLRPQDAVGTLGLVGIGTGKLGLTGKMSTYFGSSALYAKYLGGTETSVHIALTKDGQTVHLTLPRVKFEKGTVTVQGENQDVMADIDFRAILDPTTGCTVQIDAIEEGA